MTFSTTHCIGHMLRHRLIFLYAVCKKIRRFLIWNALFSFLIIRFPDILPQYTFRNRLRIFLGLFRCCMPPQTFPAADAHNT